MNRIQKAVVIVLCSILAVQIITVAGYAILSANNRGFFAKQTKYYSADIYQADYEKILSEFNVPISAVGINKAVIIASSNGETVLFIETVADISNISDQMQNALYKEYGDTVSNKLSFVVFADVFRYGKAQQLWRLENENVKVTAYQGYTMEGRKQEKYVLSVRLPIDKYAFAKQNGTETDGFPKGKVKPVEEDQIIGEMPYI